MDHTRKVIQLRPTAPEPTPDVEPDALLVLQSDDSGMAIEFLDAADLPPELLDELGPFLTPPKPRTR